MTGTSASKSRRWGELAALSGLAIAQPLLGLVGENAVFVVAHDLFGLEVVAFAIGVALVPWIAAIVVDESARLIVPDFYPVSGSLIRGCLIALFLVPVLLERLVIDVVFSTILYVTVAGLATLVWLRWSSLRSVVAALWFAPLLIVFWFVVLSGARPLVFQGKTVAEEATGMSDASVVWMVFDQLPLSLLIDESGELAAERFPNFARLAKRATWFSRATTISSSTVRAVPAALTGRFPTPGALPVVSQAPQNLFTLLAGTHDVHAWETFTQLCPDAVCGETIEPSAPALVVDTGVVAGHLLFKGSLADALLPPIDHGWSDFGRVGSVDLTIEGEATNLEEVAARRTRGDDRKQVEAFLDSITLAEEPSLHYLHIEKPHEPMVFLPDGRDYPQCGCFAVDDDGRWPHGAMTAQRLQQYLLQTMYVDTVLGKTLDAIDSSNRADRTLLVVMSDHGVSLLPGSSNRRLEAANADDILPVPVFVMEPGQDVGRLDTRAIQLPSILPTVLDHLGLTAPDPIFDGISLRDSNARPPSLEVIDSDRRFSLTEAPDARKSPLIPWLDMLSPLPGNPYAWGAGSSLFGRDVSAEAAGNSQLDVSLSTPLVLEPVGSGTALAHIFGEIHGADGETDVVAAIDGVVAGSGTSFFTDRWVVSVMIDPEMIGPSSSRIQLFELVAGELLEIDATS